MRAPVRAPVRSLMLALVIMLASALPAEAQAAAARLGAGVYVQLGDNGEISRDNGGEIANRGLLIGRRSVLVIDTGGSRRAGQNQLTALRTLSAKPVTAAVLTHAGPDFIFGAAAFQDAGVPIWSSVGTAALMQARCSRCLQQSIATLGAGWMRGTRVVEPDMQVAADLVIDLGDRVVDLMHFAAAGSPGDLAVFDRNSGTLFAGGLIMDRRIPNLRDADLDGWLFALERLDRAPVAQVVPGYGAVGSSTLIRRMQAYLQALDQAVRLHYERGDSLIETMQHCELPEFSAWQGYSTRHAQNVLYRYRQLETADLHAPDPPPPDR